MRAKIIAGNWKMNHTFDQAEELIGRLAVYIDENDLGPKEVIIFPPSVYIELAGDLAEDTDLYFGAQNICQHESGAYTGEISAPMLTSMGAEFVIVGHSERRSIFKETNELLAKKTMVALKNDLTPIFCVGEQLAEREAETHFAIIKTQLEEGLFHLSEEDIDNCIIAYEPVWAIGTGVTASPDQAEEMHAYIRSLVAEKYGDVIADNMSILYGGSVKPNNASEIFSKENVDGGLIGGASLNFEDFVAIIEA